MERGGILLLDFGNLVGGGAHFPQHAHRYGVAHLAPRQEGSRKGLVPAKRERERERERGGVGEQCPDSLVSDAVGCLIALGCNRFGIGLLIGEHHVHHVDGLRLIELHLALAHYFELFQHAATEAFALVRGILLVQHHLLNVAWPEMDWFALVWFRFKPRTHSDGHLLRSGLGSQPLPKGSTISTTSLSDMAVSSSFWSSAWARVSSVSNSMVRQVRCSIIIIVNFSLSTNITNPIRMRFYSPAT